ncbi:MAG TPA: hypothetical protein VFT60_12205, partial [Bryobacteraceae bacterium]|nr:hypothetical protein [Bryobacteraceae bacterium]
MMRSFPVAALCALAALSLQAQQYESESGFGLRGTVSGMAAASTDFQWAPRSPSGSLLDGGV